MIAKVLRLVLIGFLYSIGLFSSSAADKASGGLPPEIITFINAKEAHARALAKERKLKVSNDVWAYFRTARSGKLAATTNAFERLKKRVNHNEDGTADPTVATIAWQAAVEVELAVEAFVDADGFYATEFGRSVVKSIPSGSIYFGGTDCGRGLVTAYCASHQKGDPFFTLTQNQLADARYLEYIEATYGGKIQTPNSNDLQKVFTAYLEDAEKRLEHDRKFPNEPRQIKPGEDVRIVDNRVRVSGQIAVMAINGLLCKFLFDANTNREFYVEESFPLDWMFPHLSPHGLIFKLNREPLASLSDEAVKRDRAFWMAQQAPKIGDWLKPETPVKDVCDFVRATYGRKEFSTFKGDRAFVTNSYASRLYSKLRSSIAGLYSWHHQNSKDPEFKQRMLAEADFASRQAFAFCPYSPEAIFRYANLLVAAERYEDASRIAATARMLDPDNSQLENLSAELSRLKRPREK